MIRKTIIYLIGALILTTAVTQVWTFLLPVFDSTQPKIFDPTRIVMGILFFLAGWNLLKFDEAGRALTLWLLFLGLAWNIVILALTLPSDSDFGVSLKFLGKTFWDSKENYISTIIFLSMVLVINLAIIIFLSQRATKRIFMSEAIDNVEAR